VSSELVRGELMGKQSRQCIALPWRAAGSRLSRECKTAELLRSAYLFKLDKNSGP